MSNQASGLHPGDVVGAYRVEDPVARGRMARVYRATDADGRVVALKLMDPQLAADPQFVKRFEREARIANRIDHPAVVPVLDSGRHSDFHYLVQPLLGGGSLSERTAGGPLDAATAIAICARVASGLDALHDVGLVHRDVKPGNILLDDEGLAHISDFGLAKQSDGTVLTRPGQALGSLQYMAPEQIRGEDVTAATDIYALGCVLFEALTGAPPFGGRPTMRTLFAHLQEAPPDPARRRPGISPQLARAVLQALEKDPVSRPFSASAYTDLAARAASP